MKIRTKLTLTIAAIIVALGSTAVYFVFSYSNRVITAEKHQELKLATNAKSAQVEQLFYYSSLLVETIASRPEFAEYVEALQDQATIDALLNQEANDEEGAEIVELSSKLQPEDIKQSLADYNINNSYSALYLMNLDGLTLVSTDPNFVNNNYSFRNYFTQSLEYGATYVDVAIGATSNQLGYYFSAPIKVGAGRVVGIAVIKMDPDVIDRILDNNEFGIGTNFMLTDEYGVILHSDDVRRVFSSLTSLSSKEIAELQAVRRYEGVDIKALDYGAVKDLLSDLDVADIVYDYDDLDKRAEILSVSRVGQSSFYLVLEEDAKAISQSVARIAYVLALFVVLAAIVSVFVILIIVSYFVAPIKDLNEFARNVARGRFKQTISIKTKDEFYSLSKNLNKMAAKLHRYRSKTEKEIKDRTERLSKMNKALVGREKRMMELKQEVEAQTKKRKKKNKSNK